MPAYEDAVNIIEELGIEINELSEFPKSTYEILKGRIKIINQNIVPTLLAAIKWCGSADLRLNPQSLDGTLNEVYSIHLNLDRKTLGCSSEGEVDKKTQAKLKAVAKKYRWTPIISEDTEYGQPSS